MIDTGSLFAYLVFVFGAIVGSFLNVCIVRLPKNESIVFPSSHCPLCKTPINWFDNIPCLSFILLGGHCRACKGGIPVRYFGVEWLTGILFFLTYMVYGPVWALVPAFLLIAGLVVASFVDLDWRIIPDEISVGGMFAGLLMSAVIPALHRAPGMEVLATGSMVSFILAGSCMALHLFKLLSRRLPFEREDKGIFVLGTSFLALQWAALSLAGLFPSAMVYLAAFADALQGVLIGACSLWATGLIGEVLITKRVVTEFDFKGVVDDPVSLLKGLHGAGYVDARGNLQAAFRAVKSAAALNIPLAAEPRRAEIFEVLQAVDEGGVMGWGDVKLLAMGGAFLGWQMALVAFFIAPFLGAFFGLIKILRRQDSAIAYGPFLAAGLVVALLAGVPVLHWVLKLYQVS